MRTTVLLLIPALVGLVACGERASDPTEGPLTPVAVGSSAEANFTLLVSNQSLVDRLVDIEVRVDGHVVAADDYDVEGEETVQHNVFWYHFRLEPGAHELTATAKDGTVGTSKTLLIDGPRWASVDYWKSASDERSSLQLVIRDEPIRIE